VTPLAGWATVQAAVQHWQLRERLSITSAFDAATRGAHWAAFADNAGTVQVGAVASLAVWDVEPGGVNGEPPLPALRDGVLPTCAATISAGQLIYQSESFVGSRLRRAEEERADTLSSASDDEVGGLHGAIRAERAQASGAIKLG
jgi:cytosine/adenosine deaminase-related metal-dependent hydrolase